VTDGTPLLLATLLVGELENDDDGEPDSEPPTSGEVVPLLETSKEGLPWGEYDAELLTHEVPLPAAVDECKPLSLVRALPVGAPTEDDGEEVSVPASLLVLEGDIVDDSHTVRDGAAFVRDAQAVEEALAFVDGDAVKVLVLVHESVTTGVAEESAPVMLGLPESDPASAEEVAHKDAPAVPLALPEAVFSTEGDAKIDAERDKLGVEHVVAETLRENEALLDKDEVELALAGAEGEADSETKEPLLRGVALLVSNIDSEEVLLAETVALFEVVPVADIEMVMELVPLILPVDVLLPCVELVEVGEDEEALVGEAAAEAEAAADNVEMAVAEELFVVLDDELAVHDAKALKEAGAEALAVLLPCADCEGVTHVDAVLERAAEAVEVTDEQSVALVEMQAVVLLSAVGVSTPESERAEVDVCKAL
jgi:hypothetical protein